MNKLNDELWGMLSEAVGVCLSSGCAAEPATVSDQAQKLFDTLLLLAYNPAVNPDVAHRVADVIRHSFQLGRVCDRLNRVLTEGK